MNCEIEDQCRTLELMDIIEPSQSSWSSPVVPVRKLDGSIRLCVDYRKLNAVTIADRFPLPNLNDAIFGLKGMKYFTSLDLVKGYYQVPLDKHSKQFTAFSTPRAHWQFKRLSFGLRNAPSSFQRVMQTILSDFPWRKVIVYIDDVLIMGETFEEHLQLVERVIRTLSQHGVTLNLEKCKWCCQKVEFLGHVVSEEGLQKPETYMNSVMDFKRPVTKRQLREFLGLVNFQRKFVPNCSLIMKPLSRATGGKGKNVTLHWTSEMDDAFTKLKLAIGKAVTLAFPDYSDDASPLALYTDASGAGMGACLAQKQNGVLRAVAYASTSFNGAEENYSTMEKELAAIRWAVKTFRPFLFGVEFTVHTDHRPLLYLYNMKIVNARLARTLQELAEYNFTIVFTPGRENVAADALSRMEYPAQAETSEKESSECLPYGIVSAKEVPGGGDSLISSLEVVGRHLESYCSHQWNAQELRKAIIDELRKNPSSYGLKCEGTLSRELRRMELPGQILCPEAISAFAQLHGCLVFVHYGIEFPVVHRPIKSSVNKELPRVHLQCLGGVHFNPVLETARYQVPIVHEGVVVFQRDDIVEERELIGNVTSGDFSNETTASSEEDELVGALFTPHVMEETSGAWCDRHHKTHSASIMLQLGDMRCCALIDTGAQVSCVLVNVLNALQMPVEAPTGNKVVGVGSQKSSILGSVSLELTLDQYLISHKFVVVEESSMGFCLILGADFLIANEWIMDMGRLCCRRPGFVDLKFSSPVVSGNLFSMVLVHEDEDRDVGPVNNVDSLQASNFQLRLLRKSLGKPLFSWPQQLKKYRRYNADLGVEGDIIVYQVEGRSVPVVPFKFMVEVALTLHRQRSHPGRQKLLSAVKNLVWHPSVSVVVADISRTCERCQKLKVAGIAQPPVTRIETSSPFELVAVDLISLPRTQKGSTCCLVVVDHNSKWLATVPLRTKTAKDVAEAMKSRILPGLPAIPQRVLSDNGPEFSSRLFNEVLEDLNIHHVYSTPYRPSSNGLVERVNRTLTELLRSEGATGVNWDGHIPKVVITYNNSLHSELSMSPSCYLMTKTHVMRSSHLLSSGDVNRWREGNPSFVPFKVGQLVWRKVVFKGRKLEDKLTERYDGPYKVVLAHGNKLTYVIKHQETGKEYRAHYTQLRRCYLPPRYLRDHPSFLEGEVEREEELDDSELVKLRESFDEKEKGASYALVESSSSD